MAADDLVLCSGTLPARRSRSPTGSRRPPGPGSPASRCGAATMRPPGPRGSPTRTSGPCSPTTASSVAELDPAWWWLPGAAEVSIPPALDTEDVFGFGEADLFAVADAVGARSLNAVDVFGGELGDRRRGRGVRRPVRPGGGPRAPRPPRVAALVEDPRPRHRLAEIVRLAAPRNGGLNVDAWHLVRAGCTPEDLADVPGELRPRCAARRRPAGRRGEPGRGDVARPPAPRRGRVRPRRHRRCAARHRHDGADRGRGVLRRAPRACRPLEAAQRAADTTRQVLREAG